MIGYIAGVLTVLAILAVETFLESKRMEITGVMMKPIKRATRLKGAVYEAPADLDYAREQVIRANDQAGLDTNLSDLE